MILIELIMVMKVKRTRKMSKHIIIERQLKEKMIEKDNEEEIKEN